MHEMICPRCGTIAQVTPDADRCPGCSQSLKRSIPNETAARYFYEQAEAIAVREGAGAALKEAERGLAYAPTSELLLLAAILAEQQGAYDLMRRYVLEIPLEDTLREEAEWLLRAHQMRQRALRQGQMVKAQALPEHPTDVTNSLIHTPREQSTRVLDARADRARQRIWPTAIALLLLLAVLWTGWDELRAILDSSTVPPLTQPTAPQQETADVEDLVSAPNASGDGSAPLSRDLVQPAVNSNIVTPEAEAPAADAGQTLGNNSDATIVSTPEESGAADGAGDEAEPVPQATNTPEPIVDSTPGGALLSQNLQPFDILAYFKEAGRPDLAQLPVDAQIREGELIVYGVVPWAEHRRDILEVTQNVPDVARVNSVDLRVRVPATYTVQAGDTLWIIAYRLYDDPARWPEIVSHNQALIPDPQSLRLGSTIQVPPAR